MKQAPRAWYTELRNYLLSVGFSVSLSDASLFMLRKYGLTLYFLIYVDDIIITGNTTEGVSCIIQGLTLRFSLKDLGPLNYFLGVQVQYSGSGVYLSQSKYIIDLLADANMDGCKGMSTPMSSQGSLYENCGSLVDDKVYRRLLGKLQYLSFTRPDISFTVNKLAQFMHKPLDAHRRALKRLLRYLHSTCNHGLHISSVKDSNGLCCILWHHSY